MRMWERWEWERAGGGRERRGRRRVRVEERAGIVVDGRRWW